MLTKACSTSMLCTGHSPQQAASPQQVAPLNRPHNRTTSLILSLRTNVMRSQAPSQAGQAFTGNPQIKSYSLAKAQRLTRKCSWCCQCVGLLSPGVAVTLRWVGPVGFLAGSGTFELSLQFLPLQLVPSHTLFSSVLV